MLQGEPHPLAFQIDITKRFRPGAFEILLRKVYN